jgi:hypothetical protein
MGTQVHETVDITLDGARNISVSDAVTVQEYRNLAVGTLGVAVYDGITVAENVTGYTLLPVTVGEDIAVSENVSAIHSLVASVYDGISVAEASSTHKPSATSLNLEEWVNVDIQTILEHNIGVDDSITLDESVDVYPSGVLSVNDSISTGESVSTAMDDLAPSVADNVQTTESLGVAARSDLSISVYDQASVQESIQGQFVTLDYLFWRSHGRLNFAEIVSQVSALQVSVTDSCTVTDTAASALPDLEAVVSEAVTVGEQTALSFESTISVNDSVSVSEDVTASLAATLLIQVTASDSVKVVEFSTARRAALAPTASDSISVAEAVTVSVGPAAELAISTSEAVTVFEAVGGAPDALFISCQDGITVSEYASKNVRPPAGTVRRRKSGLLTGVY